VLLLKKAITGACWGAVFVGGWLAGHQSISDDFRAESLPRAGRSRFREIRTWSSGESLEALKGLAALPDLRFEDRLEMERHFARLPMEDVRRLSLLKREDLQDPFDETSEEKSVNSVLRKLAVEEWCRRDPFGILDSGDEWFDADRSIMLRAAALKDPERARNHPTVKDRRLGYRERTGLLQGLAEAAPELAFATARKFSQEQFEYTDLSAVAECFHDQARRLEWMSLVFERRGSSTQPKIYQIMSMIAEDDPTLLEKFTDLPVLQEYRVEASRFVRGRRWKNIPPGDPVPVPTDGEEGADAETFGQRVGQWFVKDPAAVCAWLDDFSSDEARRSQIVGLARETTMRDLQTLDRMMETFTESADREAIQRCAVFLLSDGNTSTKAALLAFVGKYPEARQYVRKPQYLES
jgi:hypothetical protein